MAHIGTPRKAKSIIQKLTRYGVPFIEDNNDLNEIFFDNQLKAEQQKRLDKIKFEID